MESSLESHFDRIKKRLSDGRSALTSLHKTKDLKPYAIPNATVDLLQLHAPPPQDSDPCVSPPPFSSHILFTLLLKGST